MLVLSRFILNITPDSTKPINTEQNLRSVTSNELPVEVKDKAATPKLVVPSNGAVLKKEIDTFNAVVSIIPPKNVPVIANASVTTPPSVVVTTPTPPSTVVINNNIADDEPWHIIMAHEPRYDLLGSFVLPTLLLHAVTHYNNWTLHIFPFAGSSQHAILTQLFAQKGNLTKDWGSGFQDASHRADYNPMELNDQSYETMGFFPEVSKDQTLRTKHPWIRRDEIPLSIEALNQVCQEGNMVRNKTDKNCYILLSDNPNKISEYIKMKGGIDLFFTPEFSHQMRRQFLLKNEKRLEQQYGITTSKTGDTPQNGATNEFNVAVHIRRGDILHPDRWIDQHVFANVARHICQTNTVRNENLRTNIHVFSSGPNRDGNWSKMEQLAEPVPVDGNDNNKNSTIPSICSNVYVHVDEVEFDSWTFMIAADALVISPSTFGYVPSLIRYDDVYFPRKFWHPVLSSFNIFDDKDGTIISKQ
jgi:hypothetical protein